jgi:hypothetical protein
LGINDGDSGNLMSVREMARRPSLQRSSRRLLSGVSGWQLEPEALSEPSHVGAIVWVWLVAAVSVELALRRAAEDWPSGDLARHRGAVVKEPATGQPLVASAILARLDGMQIDPAAIGIAHRKRGWKQVTLDSETACLQQFPRARDPLDCDDEVEVVVLARLLSQESIDSPAAVDPHHHPDLGKRHENVQHLPSRDHAQHHCASETGAAHTPSYLPRRGPAAAEFA